MRFCTLPTGARWSVAVGQAVTNVIVDIDTPVIVHTLIDNIMIAAHDGMEKEFLSATRRIERIREPDRNASPWTTELPAKSNAKSAKSTRHGTERSAWYVTHQDSGENNAVS
eukprot:gene5816-biopygen3670